MKSILLFLFTGCIINTYCQDAQDDSIFLKAITEAGYRNTTHKVLGNFAGIGTDGRFYTKDSLLNKVTLINFWFEACPPCVAEFGPLNSLYDKYKANTNFQFLSVTCDSFASALLIVARLNIKYPVISLKKPDVNRLIFDLGYPTTMIIDQSGNITLMKSGGFMDPQEILEEFETIYEPEIDRLLSNH